ncbi:MAG: hypothetical protein GEU78_16245 [Actinobacteria bacterium]|nr:hypothetical protein [Actinomycetota bacterium]
MNDQSWPDPVIPVPDDRTSGVAAFWASLGAAVYMLVFAFLVFTAVVAGAEEGTGMVGGVLFLILLVFGVPLLWLVPGVMAARPAKRITALAWLLWFGPFGLIAVFGNLR